MGSISKHTNTVRLDSAFTLGEKKLWHFFLLEARLDATIRADVPRRVRHNGYTALSGIVFRVLSLITPTFCFLGCLYQQTIVGSMARVQTTSSTYLHLFIHIPLGDDVDTRLCRIRDDARTKAFDSGVWKRIK